MTLEIVKVSRASNKPVRGLPRIQNYPKLSRDVTIKRGGGLYKLTVPASDSKGRRWTQESLSEHVTYYQEYYMKVAIRLENEFELAQSAEVVDVGVRAHSTVLFKLLNATRAELRLPEITEERFSAEVKKILQPPTTVRSMTATDVAVESASEPRGRG